MEFFVYAIISAAISAFQARPTDVTIAGKRNFRSAGNTMSFILFKYPNLKTLATSSRFLSIELKPSTVLCQIIGMTIRNAINTDSTSPLKITHNTTMKDATGVERMTVIKGESREYTTFEEWAKTPNPIPSMIPTRRPTVTLKSVKNINLYEAPSDKIRISSLKVDLMSGSRKLLPIISAVSSQTESQKRSTRKGRRNDNILLCVVEVFIGEDGEIYSVIEVDKRVSHIASVDI